MRLRQYLRRESAIFLAGVIAFTMCGCGKSQKESQEASTAQPAEESTQAEDEDYVASDITLPDNFDHMIYPLEAVMVDYYAQGYSFYKEGDDSKSFWCSMAVLSSLLSENECVEPAISDNYSFYSDDQINEFASALYADFLNDKMGLADCEDDDPYVIFDEDLAQYGLLNGSVGDLSIYITSCTPSSSGYVIGATLIDLESGDELEEFEISIEAQKDVAQGSMFFYSISDMTVLSEDGTATDADDSDTSASDSSDESGPTAESDYDEVDGVEITDDDVDLGDYSDDEEPISKNDALSLAKNYMGEDYKYTYKQMVTIGEDEYYDFGISGGNSSMTDVLVCSDGSDVVSGVQNDDGSWSLEQ